LGERNAEVLRAVSLYLRRLHNEELSNLYASRNVARVIKTRRRWAALVARMGKMGSPYGTLIVKPEGKRPLRRPRCRWEDSIVMDHKEIGSERVGWMHLAQDRDQWRALVNTVMDFPGNFLTSWSTISFSLRTLLHEVS
jgi:hypothetical protein